MVCFLAIVAGATFQAVRIVYRRRKAAMDRQAAAAADETKGEN